MTYLRSIRLRGFKTFARSTEMLFEPGVTVVIGPNGSGKSNITDAVLWVLGEQSPTQLRGRNMQDVIFAGSDGRRRAPFAEVALVLDNSRGNLPTEFTEVEVVRRLQRDGSSEYRLNGAACRLLDVQELLSSAGLGREMHSVVGQGQVDAVLNSTPAERRALVEEAAGLGRYKKRRERAQSKLEKVRGNLGRVLDLEGEVRKALRPLKAQVHAAEKHAELSEKLADARTRVLLQELDGLDSRTRKVKSREESVRERQKKGEAELKDVRLQRETEENRFAEVLADRDVATADYHRAKGDLDRLTARGEAVERRLAGLRTEVERAERQRTSVEAALADVENRLMVLRDMPDHTSGRLEAVENVATAVTEEARALRPEMEADERKAEELRDLILEQESARSRIQQSLELLEQEKQDLGRRGDKAAEQVEVARNRKSEAEGAVEALRTQVEDARKNVSTSREEVMAKENELSAASSVAQETRSLVRDGKKELESAQTRLQVLRDALARRDGISDSARHLLDSISGAQLVTDALRVPEGLEKALSVALGPLAQGVLIPLEGREEDAVAFLGQGAGSVEVLCPDGSDSEDRSQSSPPVGRSLWEEVDGPEEVVRFLAQLLPSTALVEDLTAVSAAALASGWRCIDAAGQVIEGPGHAARRAETVTEGLLSLHAEAEALGRRVPELERRVRSLEEREVVAESAREKARLTLEERQSGAREADVQVATLEAEISTVVRRAEEAGLEAEEAEKRGASSLARLEELEGENADAHRNLCDLEEDLEAARGELSEVRERARDSHQRLDYLLKKSSQARMLMVRLRERERTRNQKLEQAYAGRKEREAALSLARFREAALKSVIPKVEELRLVAHGLLKSFSGSIELLESRMEDTRESTDAFGAVLKNLGRREAELQQSMTGLGEELVRVEVELTRLKDETAVKDTELQDLRRRHKAPREVSVEEAREDDREELVARIERLEGRRVRLGPVNPLAEQEHRETKERADSLAEQREDLSASIDELESMTADLDRHIASEFENVFAAANDYFKDMIEVLFPGGRGEMVLTSPPRRGPVDVGSEGRQEEDSDEEEREQEGEAVMPGIGLKIKLPRKAPQNLSLLSGGEKALAAVAFLFSLFLAHPCPFYVLDEVEAALDDANLGRFLSVIRQYQDQTQFIIITHQRRTMEIASTLYGVAMGKDGTSHLLSRRLAAEGEAG